MGPSNDLSVRLGVSPTAASTPTGVFNQWFEALFPHAGVVGCAVCHRVHQPPPCCEPSPPLVPISAPSTSLGECFFFMSLVVGLPYSLIFCQFGCFLFLNCCCPSFGCVRRHRVSTYASILARSSLYITLNVPSQKLANCKFQKML